MKLPPLLAMWRKFLKDHPKITIQDVVEQLVAAEIALKVQRNLTLEEVAKWHESHATDRKEHRSYAKAIRAMGKPK